MRFLIALGAALVLTTGCSGPQTSRPGQPQEAAPAVEKLGIRPNGDTTIQPDTSQVPDELKAVYQYIDDHIDEHVINLRKWIQQPSISNSGEGIPESAEMVKGFFDQLGCQETRVYDPGVTEYGMAGNPLVYARCNEGAPKTLIIYWMYDTMPITQPDAWMAPPFEGRIVEFPPFKKAMIGRGATNSKGPQMVQWNAMMAIKAVSGKLPVNLIVVAEGDEERQSIGYRKLIRDQPELFNGADAMYRFGSQGFSGGGELSGGSEGLLYIELTTSGNSWGHGPLQSNIHGANKRAVDSPAWRHIKMLSSLISDDGNTPRIAGFNDNIEPLKPEEIAKLKNAAKAVDLKIAAQNLGVARFISDDPFTMLKMSRYGTSFNLDGIWGGNMYAGGAGAILPNKVTSKHNIRYVPNMNSEDLLKKIRAQLDKNGYQDVEMKVIGDMPWSKMRYDTDVARALMTTYDIFQIPYSTPPAYESILGGAWPAYLATEGPHNKIPIVGGAAGYGGNAHAANEFYVIEGTDKLYGMAGAEKSVATVLYAFAGKVKFSPKAMATSAAAK